MSSTEIVWFRRDLRVRDHPALHGAASDADRVVPVFVVDPAIVEGSAASGPRAHFLAGCLRELDAALRDRGGRLIVRRGDPADVLVALAEEVGAEAVRWTSDASPYARRRDERVTKALEDAGVRAVPCPGQYVADPSEPRTGGGKPYVVFSPFGRAWDHLDRRKVLDAPRELSVPQVGGDGLPAPDDLGADGRPDVPEPFAEPGEEPGLRAARAWLDGPIQEYHELHDALAGKDGSTRAAGGGSGLSAHLRWGTISPRWLEARARKLSGEGPAAFVRQLAWRDFYAHVYLFHPEDRHRAHQPKYRDLTWEVDDEALEAWKAGRTGYPLVDAGMRQLASTGWMHNRARMIVGSFLTKDLHIDWTAGERHFYALLLDGEPTQNDGNWQWVTSIGVDPKPYFQRMFNPTRQMSRFDSDGRYVRRWVPELADVPDARIQEPWKMSREEQDAAGCVIGEDYPEPIVDHKVERERAAARYREAGD
ncbi:deoxyribodipyrimidine photo-lyase [Patulibacter sp.]|uniref:cryptochrome/photolyase family protein n=1 Tax=Patulibacter sp. TaxID=1912859 RepID=UPI0027168782|nr:deoxyribodipyrimidine photo-lyase [Patulibacter sp.]MDO9410794.1 deoxyribodipyrimidine photo-lyase [Patulibacter sp.]